MSSLKTNNFSYLKTEEEEEIKKAEEEIFNELWSRGYSIGMIERIGKRLAKISELPYEEFMRKIKFK